MKIRAAHLNDISRLNKLVNSAYRGEYSKKGWTTEADLLGGQRTDEAMLREIIQTPGQSLQVMENDSGEICACAFLAAEKPETLYFGMLTVEPQLQGQGIAKKMLQHIEGLALSQNFKFVRLTVLQMRTELIAYYERRGFVATGRYEDFPDHDESFGIPVHKGMKLLEYKKDLKP